MLLPVRVLQLWCGVVRCWVPTAVRTVQRGGARHFTSAPASGGLHVRAWKHWQGVCWQPVLFAGGLLQHRHRVLRGGLPGGLQLTQAAFGSCSSSIPPVTQLPVSADQTCGSLKQTTCPEGCCSKYGWCGTTTQHCAAGCQVGFGLCSSPTVIVTPIPVSPTAAPSPSPSLPLSTDLTCGKNTQTVCPGSFCCSQYGYCGSTTAYCGSGCQSGFGLCSSTPSITPPAPSTIPTVPTVPSNPDFAVITRSGSKLMNNNQQFRFVSYNVPNYLLLEGRSDGWVPPTPDEQNDAMLSIAGSFGQVARTYTLGYGASYHMTGPGSYNEEAFVAFDHGLAKARNNGVRLIIPLVNNHWGDDYASLPYGDYGLIAQFRSLSPSQFYISGQLRTDFKGLLYYMLNRVNTVNGIRYPFH